MSVKNRMWDAIRAFKGQPIGSLTFGVDIRKCSDCEYKNRSCQELHEFGVGKTPDGKYILYLFNEGRYNGDRINDAMGVFNRQDIELLISKLTAIIGEENVPK